MPPLAHVDTLAAAHPARHRRAVALLKGRFAGRSTFFDSARLDDPAREMRHLPGPPPVSSADRAVDRFGLAPQMPISPSHKEEQG
jgi:hypothetical protein